MATFFLLQEKKNSNKIRFLFILNNLVITISNDLVITILNNLLIIIYFDQVKTLFFSFFFFWFYFCSYTRILVHFCLCHLNLTSTLNFSSILFPIHISNQQLYLLNLHQKLYKPDSTIIQHV